MLASELAKGAAGKAGESVWSHLTGASAQVWEKIKALCGADSNAGKAVAEFEAHPQDRARSEALASHVQRLGERNSAQAKELAELCYQFRQLHAARDITTFNQTAQEIKNVQQNNERDGSITIN